MTRKTTSFHVSSATANSNADGTNFSIDLVPELDVGHTAEPTVYLHNLSFTNTFANVSKSLYDNATVHLTGLPETDGDHPGTEFEFDLPDGAYSLADLELAIAEQIPQEKLDEIDHVSDSTEGTGPYYANSAGELDGQVAAFGDSQFYGKVFYDKVPRELKVIRSKDLTHWKIALSIDEAAAFYDIVPEPRDADEHKAVIAGGGSAEPSDEEPLGAIVLQFFIKPITLEADTVSNRVRMMTCNHDAIRVDFSKSSLFTKLLGFGPDQHGGETFTFMDAPKIAFGTALNPARIDKTRAVSFHCPSLASGTYSTTGKMGGSQLAMVPITVGVGEVQSWEASVPIKIPSSVAGSVRHKLHFFLSNEDGDPISTLGERFEAVMVLEYDV